MEEKEPGGGWRRRWMEEKDGGWDQSRYPKPLISNIDVKLQ